MTKKLKIRGAQLVFEDLGQGPPILFIHGQPFNRSMWDYQVNILHSQYRLVIPDLRGYGESEIPEKATQLDELALDLIYLLEDLDIQNAVVIGLSMGGQIALEMMKWRPSIISALVIADSDARAESITSYHHRLALAQRMIDQGMKSFTELEIEKYLSPSTFQHKPAIVDHLQTMMQTTDAYGAAAVQRGRAERRDYTTLLKTIDVPTLIIVGKDDYFTPLESALYISERIKYAQLEVIEDAGHMPNMENTVAFNQVLCTFLSALSSHGQQYESS